MGTTREITETDTRATRLQGLEAQVCQARDDLHRSGPTTWPSELAGRCHTPDLVGDV